MKPTKQTPTGVSQSEPEVRRNFAAPLKEGSGANEIENALEPEARRNFAAPLNSEDDLEENLEQEIEEVPAGAGWLWCHTLTASNPMQLGGSSIPTATVCVGRDGVRSIAVLPSGAALVTYQPGGRKPVLLASWVKADLLAHHGGPVTRKGGRPRKHG